MSLSKGDNKVSEIKWNNPAPDTLDQSANTVETSNMQYPMSQTSLSVSVQQSDKPQELSVHGDLESAIEIEDRAPASNVECG